MRDGWRVSLDRLPLPLLPFSEAWRAFADGASMNADGCGLLGEDPDGERSETDESRPRPAP